MQIKSLYLALFANFDHQSMHQVLQGTLKGETKTSIQLPWGVLQYFPPSKYLF